jgi:hypothetical protein
MQRFHGRLSGARDGDAQCEHVNAMLSRRPVIIGHEHVINSVAAHYLVGFLLIAAALRSDPAVVARRPLLAAAGAVCGWLFADALSYGLHFLIDSEFWTRVVSGVDRHGFALVDVHHEFTMNYSYLSGVELVAITYPISVPALLVFSVAHFWLAPALLATSPAYLAFFSSTMAFGLMAGFSHMWAHERNHGVLRWRLVRWLQDARVLLGPGSHRKHHVVERDRDRLNFSLVSAATEPLLDPLVASLRARHE